MMVKLSILFVFVLQAAPLVLAQYGSGYDYRAPLVNTQQAYLGSTQESLNRSAGYPESTPDVYQAQQRPIQQQSQYNHQRYHATQNEYQNVKFDGYNQNFAANLLGAQNAQQTNSASSPSHVNTRAQQPVITKHIYFHLPPPDDTTAAPIIAAPPKKIYNIIFIKLPSQKSSNAARLQQLINRQAALDKTLIYVLVKKPESQPVQPVTSKPEVFFVKYKEPRSLALQVGDGAASASAPAQAGGGPRLLPGLVNGHDI